MRGGTLNRGGNCARWGQPCPVRICLGLIAFLSVLSHGLNASAQGLDWLGGPLVDAKSSSSWEEGAEPVQFQQPVSPRIEASTSVPTTATSRLASQRFLTSFGAVSSPMLADTEVIPVGASVIQGQESAVRLSTDMGDLMGGSAAALDLGIQRRNPIVNDPRVRGSQVGTLAASGSYWVPARIDLDTMASKIDSRIVDHVVVIPGPYSALFGPGKQFLDFELQRTPRYERGFQIHGATNADFRSNGDQWYGRQAIWGGDDLWGFRVGYGHRTGNDYESGNGLLIPSSYKSRDIDLAFGAQLTADTAVEGQALRLDQTDVELAGQAFDIDTLVTDGYELEYTLTNPAWADQVIIDAWYNLTVFDGSAQRASKRKQFPFYDNINFVGFTDVESLSSGYRLLSRWEGDMFERVDAGADLRYVKQRLDELTSGRVGFVPWTDANSPIPKSDYVNPGLFIDSSVRMTDNVMAVAGGRIDYVGTAVLADAAQLDSLGVQSALPGNPPLSAADIWGSGDLDANDILGLGYCGLEVAGEDGWGLFTKVGFSERAPNLTERYAVETFMALIQNGLNTVTGDPRLEKEQLIQTDVGVVKQSDRSRFIVSGFHAWVHDYITFEAMSVVTGPPAAQIEQVNLKYVNTDLATLWGWQARYEYEWNDLLTPFATLQYVQGDDRTRNGSFATQQASAGNPSMRVPGSPRGFFSGIPGDDKEPLPGIVPLESRLGLRWEEKNSPRPWGVEIAARVVDNQDRVAASLLETPTPGFTVWDVRAFLRPNERWLLVGGVENFTDKQYREHLDFRSRNPIALSSFRPGVSFNFGVEAQY